MSGLQVEILQMDGNILALLLHIPTIRQQVEEFHPSLTCFPYKTEKSID